MSRARPIHIGGEKFWFDQRRNNEKANAEQLELLAAAENIPIDDLLDESLTQGQLIERLRQALGQGVIPAEVLERRRQRKLEAQYAPKCRICDAHGWQCEGSSTKHHFVPRWLMLQLENYAAYSSRSLCTIPICIGRHRDLHYRNDEDKSIVPYLNDRERAFAQKMLDDLKRQRPAIFDLIASGDDGTYESQLIHDFTHGEFARKTCQAPATLGYRAMAEGV